MVFTLQRYIFREIFRIFVLATIALTLMLSLGSILRPVQEYGVGPQQVVHLMGYFLPITLTFVLPMAALFATTLVYGRFASDNELDACKASGVSLLTLIYPGIALAMMVSIATLVLSFHVMPAFVGRAEKSLKADAKQILFRNLQRKGYYALPDSRYLIYADQADSENDLLAGVVIVELKNDQIKRIITAQSAQITFNSNKLFNQVQIVAEKVYQMGASGQGGFYAERLPVVQEFASLLGDDIKFKKIDEVKRIRRDLMRFYPIAKLGREVYGQFTAELLKESISDEIGAKDKPFYRLHTANKIVEFTADSCVVGNDGQVELHGNVIALESNADNAELVRTIRTQKALIRIEGDQLAPTLTMELYSPHWQLPDGSEGLANWIVVRGLILPQAVTANFESADVLQAIKPQVIASSLKQGPSPVLGALQHRLGRKITKTLAEIRAEMHSRLVFGIGPVPLIMIGIGLGVLLKGGHLLTAFGASSIPAAILIVGIMMGKNVTKNLGAQAGSGILLMWSGLAFLFLLALWLYRKLLRH
ncbi:MAG: LptF/LptG family permease [Planctomycetota bacterium]|jgi:lipopolysaccharide export LptBFGC system permease protein LptF